MEDTLFADRPSCNTSTNDDRHKEAEEVTDDLSSPCSLRDGEWEIINKWTCCQVSLR
jgi:hypothetical protein